MQNANLVKTKKLYEADAYAHGFTANVLSYEDGDLVLDQTLFFPEEGGQSADRGTINGIEVYDVQIVGEDIHHYIKQKSDEELSFSPGDEVQGEIDFSRRFSNMQQHSGEHLFSGTVFRRYGINNVGFHLSDTEVTLDFDAPLSMEELLSVEAEVNAAITKNLPSEIFYVDGEEKAQLAYRSKITIDGPVRIVRFEGMDVCACCAPHVRQSGEIGVLKVISSQKHKSGIRVRILCGARAVARLAKEHRILMETADDLSASWEDVQTLVKQHEEEKVTLVRQLHEAQLTLIRQHYAAHADVEDVVFFFKDTDKKALRDVVNENKDRHRLQAVFVGDDASGYQYIVASQALDVQAIQGKLKEGFGAAGGGRPPMIEGKVKAEQALLLQFFKTLDV